MLPNDYSAINNSDLNVDCNNYKVHHNSSFENRNPVISSDDETYDIDLST